VSSHVDHYVPIVRFCEGRGNAHQRLRLVLQMHELRGHTAAETGRLLCLLLLWRCAMSPEIRMLLAPMNQV